MMAQSKFEAALQYVTLEVAKEPGNAKLNLVLGDLAVQAGQMEIAAVRFQRAVDILSSDPNAAALFVKRSSIRPPQSLKTPFEAALDNFIGNDTTPAGPGGVHLRLAEAYLVMGDGPRGVQALERARRFLPGNTAILMNLALLYEVARDGAHALSTYRELIRISPDEVTALNNAAFMLAENRGDLNEALRYAQHARELMPKSPEVADTLGWVYYRRKAYKEALPLFVGLLKTSPDNAAYRNHLFQTLQESGEKPDGAGQLMALLNEPPREENSRALSELLAKIYP
jgi:tetratricopeptide (TPR) repeat protein